MDQLAFRRTAHFNPHNLTRSSEGVLHTCCEEQGALRRNSSVKTAAHRAGTRSEQTAPRCWFRSSCILPCPNWPGFPSCLTTSVFVFVSLCHWIARFWEETEGFFWCNTGRGRAFLLLFCKIIGQALLKHLKHWDNTWWKSRWQEWFVCMVCALHVWTWNHQESNTLTSC